MLELLSPAGTAGAVAAVVGCGADSIYIPYGGLIARRGGEAFSDKNLQDAAMYCRMRGVKCYVLLGGFATDRDFSAIADAARKSARAGVDALIVDDLGVLRIVRQCVPDMPIFAGEAMGIRNHYDAMVAAAAGIKRVAIGRETGLENIRRICEALSDRDTEVEVCVHGPQCVSLCGQCHMGTLFSGREKWNCGQPCRQRWNTGSRTVHYPLTMKDICLVGHIRELARAGVDCIRIGGLERRTEYAALATAVYSQAAKKGTQPSERELQLLAAFSNGGLSDGFFTGSAGVELIGFPPKESLNEQSLIAIRRGYNKVEYPRIPVSFAATVTRGEPVRLAARDDRGNVATAKGPIPEPAF
ncbi:MAG: U32 family peptidase [Oscillospiraceae bacterium]|nr:U32 family peptidase [Oscillospiraceae bacterium]